MTPAILHFFSSEIIKHAGVGEYVKDFVGGMDPMGTVTTGYGQEAQRAGVSENKHRLKHGLTTAGGLIGGATVVPSAIYGVVEGAKGVAKGKGLKGRSLEGGRGFARGFKQPLSEVYHATKANRALTRARKVKKGSLLRDHARLNAKEKESLKKTLRKAEIGSVIDRSKNTDVATAKQLANVGALKTVGTGGGRISPEIAAQLQPQIQEGLNTGLAQLGLGGVLGGIGAYSQYKKGRDLEKATQRRVDEASKLASKDPRLAKAGVDGFNSPKRTPGHPKKSHVVVAKEGDRVQTIRFGQQGVKTNQTAGQRRAFKSRHAKNISKGKMSAAYWADKAKWSAKDTKDKDNPNWVKGS